MYMNQGISNWLQV